MTDGYLSSIETFESRDARRDRELGELLADVRRIAEGFDGVRMLVERATRERGPALDDVTAYGVRVILERLSLQVAAADRVGAATVQVARADVARVIGFLARWEGSA